MFIELTERGNGVSVDDAKFEISRNIVQLNFNSSNTDGSFTMANSNSF